MRLLISLCVFGVLLSFVSAKSGNNAVQGEVPLAQVFTCYVRMTCDEFGLSGNSSSSTRPARYNIGQLIGPYEDYFLKVGSLFKKAATFFNFKVDFDGAYYVKTIVNPCKLKDSELRSKIQDIVNNYSKYYDTLCGKGDNKMCEKLKKVLPFAQKVFSKQYQNYCSNFSMSSK